MCWPLQPHAAAARARVEYRGAGGAGAGAVGDAAQQVQVHPADEWRELSGEPVERAVTQDQRAVGRFVAGVAAWLAGIIVNLLLLGRFYDVALRDFGLLVAALALSRLAAPRRPADSPMPRR